MSHVKLEMPEHFRFSATIPVRITDLNYGNHVGNDTILSLIHEARMQFLVNYGYSEMILEGASLIMRDVIIEFKNELFYGDQLTVSVAANDFTRAGFNIWYKMVNAKDSSVIALARTGMVCYNYDLKKVVSVPEGVKMKLTI